MSGAMKYAVSESSGCRAPGGGRKDHFKDYKDTLKAWCVKERNHGHSLNSGDVWQEYKFILEEAIRSLRWKAGKLEEQDEERRALRIQAGMLQQRILKVQASPSYMKDTRGELVKYCGLRLLKPQRLVNLSPKEELVRCHLTWQMLDEKLWQVAFAGDEELQEMVVDVPGFKATRRQTALIFADQVPWRGKIGGGTQLYFADERPSRKQVQAAKNAGLPLPNQGQSQTRGGECEDAEKYRITVELRQVILHYFEDRDPEGFVGTTAVIVGGKHCRLSNINSEGKFIRSERFFYQGQETVHEAGKPAGPLARTWRSLRAESFRGARGLSAACICCRFRHSGMDD